MRTLVAAVLLVATVARAADPVPADASTAFAVRSGLFLDADGAEHDVKEGVFLTPAGAMEVAAALKTCDVERDTYKARAEAPLPKVLIAVVAVVAVGIGAAGGYALARAVK